MTDETRQKPEKPVVLSVAQRKALQSAIDHGSATWHLSGSYDWGGWGGTRVVLQRLGFLDGICRITDAGREAMKRLSDTHRPEGER